MQIPKPSESDKELFRSVIPDVPGVEVKPMFGNLGAFVNGNMFAGLFGPAIGIRVLDEASRKELEATPGTAPFGPSERPMGEYLALPAFLFQATYYNRVGTYAGKRTTSALMSPYAQAG